VWVSDGDTIGATTGGKDPVSVRLIGINTPETKRPGYPVECYGPEASDYLKKLLPKGSHIIGAYQDFKIDKFKRELWDIWLPDGTFVQGLLMQGGYARTETWGGTNRDAVYLDTLQSIAQRNKVGLWGACPNP
jgi:micrococcal nuclease